jgi:hypothetical protein
VVQKNDWVYKIFRQKGEISQQDFQEFLEIFRRLNPKIGNVDQIRPGQQILIPLKKLEQGSLPGQASGMVTIPFVTISQISEILEAFSKKYRVAQGDWVSRLVAARFGDYGTSSYERGLELFKALNPEIKNLNLIYSGQMLNLPDPSLQNQPWYQSLFDASGRLRSEDDLGPPLPAVPVPTEAPTEQGEYQAGDPMAEAARALEGKLLKRGTFFFPQEKGRTLELDLAQFPMIELQDGTRILFANEDSLDKADLTMLPSRWKNVRVVDVPAQATVEQLLSAVFETEGPREVPTRERLSFSDHGVTVTVQAQWIKPKETQDKTETRYICITIIKDPNQRTPETIRRYLDQHDIIIKDVLQVQGEQAPAPEENDPGLSADEAVLLSGFSRKRFVKDFFDALGYTYAQNVSISFPYAGIQVNALSNLLSTRDGREVLVDFEDLYGDAIQAIEKTGFEIVQVKGDDSLQAVTTKLLDALKVSYTIDPTFLAAKRPPEYNTFINIKGFLLAEEGQPKTLLAAVPLHKGVVSFFKDRRVKVVMTGAAGEMP